MKPLFPFLSLSLAVFATLLPVVVDAAISEYRDFQDEQGEICLTGWIMDTYCIERGTLLDNSALETLRYPDRHSIHCLVDVSRCVSSGYEVLLQAAGGSDLYERAVKLDDVGNEDALQLARNTGICSTCSGSGSQRYGFAATVTGFVDPNMKDSVPPRFITTRVLSERISCDQLILSDGDTPPTSPPVVAAPVTRAPTTYKPVAAAPISEAPVTEGPVALAPVTEAPATMAPMDTQEPTTSAPVTEAPLTISPTTAASITAFPFSSAPVSAAPVTEMSATAAPITFKPVTQVPVTADPVSVAPVTEMPITTAPAAFEPVTNVPATAGPASSTTPVTEIPVTRAPAVVSAADSSTPVPTRPRRTRCCALRADRNGDNLFGRPIDSPNNAREGQRENFMNHLFGR